MGRTPRTRHVLVFRLCNLAYLYQGKLHQQALVRTLAIVHIALVHQFQCLI